MKRIIKEIIIHCSATKEDKDYTVADIDRWHRARGFRKIGYHFVIYRNGDIHVGRSLSEIGAHCKGHNAISIGICYIGGLSKDGKPKDTRTIEQKAALLDLITQLEEEFKQDFNFLFKTGALFFNFFYKFNSVYRFNH